jgi:hypothetical protein
VAGGASLRFRRGGLLFRHLFARISIGEGYNGAIDCRHTLLKTIQFVLLFSALAHGAVPLNSFDTVLGIQRDGSVVAVERFAPASPQRSILWSTSTEYPGTWGIHDPRVVQILQVTTTEGRPLHYEVRHPLGRLEVNIDAVGVKEIRLLYSVRNAVRFLHDHDELRWTAGQGWRGNVGRATLFVQVPPGLASAVRTQAYVRGRGLLPVRPTVAGPDRVWFEPNGQIGQYEQMLVDVAAPKGELKEPAIGTRLGWFLGANTIVLLPLATLAIVLLLRALKRLPERPDYTVVALYEPPQGLTPAEVGVLVDDHLDPRDVTATFLDLAIRGYIRMEPCKPDEGVTFDQHDFKLQLLRSKNEWQSLAAHERTLLFHTFYGGEWTKLSSLTLRFYAIVPLMRRQVAQCLRTKGMYWTDPDYALSARITLLLSFFGIALAVQVLGWYSFASSWVLSLLAFMISVAIVFYFGRGITSKTMKGLRAYEQILGFQEFLDSVERDRLERLPAELFEKWLPYAMALGVEHHWARNFEGVATAPPEWMSGVEEGVFDANGLVRVLATMVRDSAPSGALASLLG